MPESLPLSEGEPLSPIQRVANHIEGVVAGQPIDPDTGLQIAKKHVNGYEHNTIVYEYNPASRECRVTVDIVTPAQWLVPGTRWLRRKVEKTRPSIYRSFVYDTQYQQIVDPLAKAEGKPTHPAFQARMTELMLGLERTPLTDRPLSAFGRVLLQMRPSKKRQ